VWEAFLSDDQSSSDDRPEAPGQAGGWSDHRGGEMPAIGDREVYVRYRNGVVSEPISAHKRRWKEWSDDVGESDRDIVAWRFSDSQN